MPQNEIDQNRAEHSAGDKSANNPRGDTISANPDLRLIVATFLETGLSLGLWQISGVYAAHNKLPQSDFCVYLSLCSIIIYLGIVTHGSYRYPRIITASCLAACLFTGILIYQIGGGSVTAIYSSYKAQFAGPAVLVFFAMVTFYWPMPFRPRKDRISKSSQSRGVLVPTSPDLDFPSAALLDEIKAKSQPPSTVTMVTETPIQTAPYTRPDGRIVVQLDPERICGLFNDHMQIQAVKLVEHYFGKWMKVRGNVNDVRENVGLYMLHLEPPIGQKFLILFNQEQKDGLELLQKGDEVTVFGRIKDISKHFITLRDCELLNPESQP